MLERLVTVAGADRAVGLTLSREQRDLIASREIPGVSVCVESWRDHEPKEPYDAIVSIGAMEHFVTPDASSAERVAAYAEFFARCRELSKPTSWMSLQTIAYARGSFVQGAIAAIFPESDLPRLEQIESALAGRYEIVQMRDDASHYARTCREWLKRLTEREAEAIQCAGADRVRHYAAFLGASARGFDAGIFSLLRIQLRPV